jgi:hypothetical protein
MNYTAFIFLDLNFNKVIFYGKTATENSSQNASVSILFRAEGYFFSESIKTQIFIIVG